MPRGRKTPEEKRELVRNIVYMNPYSSPEDVAREAGLPASTVRDMLNEHGFLDDDTFMKYREQKKREFIEKAWEIIGKALEALQEKFDTPEIVQKTHMRDVAVTMGIVFEKQALASGEPTQITERKEPLLELLQEYEKKLSELKELVS